MTNKTLNLSISIHAPVKGATVQFRPIAGVDDISIHAPVKGATQDRQYHQPRGVDFNPRSREGSDE